MAKSVDWDAVELAYRAGVRSLKDIGKEFGVSDAGILKRAKRDGWARDLSAKIKAKAEAKVSAAAVSGEVSALTKLAENQVVEANAQMQADIILSHRQDVGRARKLAMKLLEELEHQSDDCGLYDELFDLLQKDEGSGKRRNDAANTRRRELLNKVIALPSRTKTMKELSETLRNLVSLEREAFGIDKGGDLAGKKFTLIVSNEDADVL